jgi:hypothetical protein
MHSVARPQDPHPAVRVTVASDWNTATDWQDQFLQRMLGAFMRIIPRVARQRTGCRGEAFAGAPAEGCIGAGLCRRLAAIPAAAARAPIADTAIRGPVLEQDVLRGDTVASTAHQVRLTLLGWKQE